MASNIAEVGAPEQQQGTEAPVSNRQRTAKTVADLLIVRLIAWGVDTIFGFPGDGINGIFEALRTRQDELKFIQVRHEEAAAFAACGYAKYTGRLGMCLATSGPGGGRPCILISIVRTSPVIVNLAAPVA